MKLVYNLIIHQLVFFLVCFFASFARQHKRIKFSLMSCSIINYTWLGSVSFISASQQHSWVYKYLQLVHEEKSEQLSDFFRVEMSDCCCWIDFIPTLETNLFQNTKKGWRVENKIVSHFYFHALDIEKWWRKLSNKFHEITSRFR